MTRIRIKLKKSAIGHPKDQKETLKALGLRKTNSEKELILNMAIQGMINKVAHLIDVETIND